MDIINNFQFRGADVEFIVQLKHKIANPVPDSIQEATPIQEAIDKIMPGAKVMDVESIGKTGGPVEPEA